MRKRNEKLESIREILERLYDGVIPIQGELWELTGEAGRRAAGDVLMALRRLRDLVEHGVDVRPCAHWPVGSAEDCWWCRRLR